MTAIDTTLSYTIGWRTRRVLWLCFIAAGMALGTAFLSRMGLYQELRDNLHDVTRMQVSPPWLLNDTAIIDIDNATMAALQSQLGSWPYDRPVYAVVLDFLNRIAVDRVVFDILLTDARDGDERLAESLAKHQNVVFASVTSNLPIERASAHRELLRRLSWPATNVPGPQWSDVLLPRAEFTPNNRTGVISMLPEIDGVLRRIPLVHWIRGNALPSMPLAALSAQSGMPLGLHYDAARNLASYEHYQWPLDADGLVRMDFPSEISGLDVVPFYQVLLAALGVPEFSGMADQLAGRTVFIGSSAGILGDYSFIPGQGRVSGLEILALTHHGLKHGHVLAPQRQWLDWLLIAIATIPALMFAFNRLTVIRIVGSVLGGAVVVFGIHFALLSAWRQSSDLLTPLTLAALELSFLTIYLVRAQQSKNKQLDIDRQASEQSSEMKSRFLTHVTHELRTPLTAIMGYNKLLAEQGLPETKRMDYIATVDRSAQQLLSLINDLLDQAKLAAGQMTVDPAPCDIQEVLDQVLSLMRPLTEAKQLMMQVDVDAQLPEYVLADAFRLRQIVINLAGNAIKFTPSGGTITLLANWSDDRLRLTVRDTGPGMTPEALSKIFEQFQQANEKVASEHGGTGLGLSISQGLARAMGGALSATSEVGTGSEFILETPAPPCDPPEETYVDPVLVVTGSHANRVQRLVLADDNPDTRALAALHLTNMGYEVLEVADGVEAVAMTQKENPDGVLMDMLMPRMDGNAATRKLRAEGYLRPIIALTALDSAEELERIRAAGCNGHLAKPFEPRQMAAALRKYLG